MTLNLATVRGYDAVLTSISHGYVDAGDVIGNFIAPVVPVKQRQGRYLKFGKEAFAAVDTLRAPMTPISTVEASFTHGTYTLEQHALGYRIAEEVLQESKNGEFGEAGLDLRRHYVKNCTARFQNAHEIRVVATVLSSLDGTVARTDPTTFVPGTSNNTLVGAARWNLATANMIADIMRWKSFGALAFGREFNAMVIGKNVQTSLASYGTLAEKNNRFFGDPGLNELYKFMGLKPENVKVANKAVLSAVDQKLKYIFDPDSILLFYRPDFAKEKGVLPGDGANMAEPAFAYTLQLEGYPKVTSERFNDDLRYYQAEIIAERKVKVVGPESGMLVKVQ